MAKSNDRKKKRWLHKLTHKYRLVVLNDSTFEEVGFIRLSRLNIMAVGGILLIVFIILIYMVIAYTPVRETIPGYPDALMRHHIRQNVMKLDSLEREIAMRDQYFDNLRRIINGDEPISHINDTTAASAGDDIVFVRSENDSLLRQRVEAEEQFRLSVTDQVQDRQELHEMHFFTPVRGIITNDFSPLDNHFGVDLVAEPNAVVKATLDGTVTMATWTLETGYVVQIQHAHNIMSVYKHNAEIFKSVGGKVRAGDAIAVIGNSGELTTGPHLHFELWYNGTPMNPAEYIVF